MWEIWDVKCTNECLKLYADEYKKSDEENEIIVFACRSTKHKV